MCAAASTENSGGGSKPSRTITTTECSHKDNPPFYTPLFTRLTPGRHETVARPSSITEFFEYDRAPFLLIVKRGCSIVDSAKRFRSFFLPRSSIARNEKGRGQALPSKSGQRRENRPPILFVENGNALPAVDAQPAVPAFGRIASIFLFSAVRAGKSESG